MEVRGFAHSHSVYEGEGLWQQPVLLEVRAHVQVTQKDRFCPLVSLSWVLMDFLPSGLEPQDIRVRRGSAVVQPTAPWHNLVTYPKSHPAILAELGLKLKRAMALCSCKGRKYFLEYLGS